MKYKICNKCGKELPATPDFFHRRSKGSKDGLNSICKKCRLNYKIRPRKQYYREYGKRNHRQIRAGHLRRRFGLTLEEYDKMFEEQKGVCAVCKKENVSKAALHIDHNHKTGKIRGLLCCACNLVLGHFEKYAKQFNSYLERNNE